MNPETHDLATWRADAPSSDLRARVVEATRPTPRRLLAPRVGLAGAMLGGVAVAVLLATAPSPAVAAGALVQRAERALSAAPIVHIRERGRDATSETWFAGDRWRVTSPVGWGGDRIFRFGRLPVPENKGGPRSLWAPLTKGKGASPAKHVESRFGTGSPVATATGNDPEGNTLGVTYWSRRNGRVVAMVETADQTRDYRMEVLAPSFFPKGATLSYADRGEALLEGESVRRVQVTAERGGEYRETWMLRKRDGLPLQFSLEIGVGEAWSEERAMTFEYPTAVPPGTFDPATLAEHGP